MPLWFGKLLFRWRKTPPPLRSDNGHDPEWAEFNLPAGIDLRILFAAHAGQNWPASNPHRG